MRERGDSKLRTLELLLLHILLLTAGFIVEGCDEWKWKFDAVRPIQWDAFRPREISASGEWNSKPAAVEYHFCLLERYWSLKHGIIPHKILQFSANPLPNFSMFSKIPAEQPIVLSSANSTPNSSLANSPTKLVPFSQDVASQGLMAIGGCRQANLLNRFTSSFNSFSAPKRSWTVSRWFTTLSTIFPTSSTVLRKGLLLFRKATNPHRQRTHKMGQQNPAVEQSWTGMEKPLHLLLNCSVNWPAYLVNSFKFLHNFYFPALVGNNPSNMPMPPAAAHFPVHQAPNNGVFGAAAKEPPFGVNFFNAFIRGNNGQQLASNGNGQANGTTFGIR